MDNQHALSLVGMGFSAKNLKNRSVILLLPFTAGLEFKILMCANFRSVKKQAFFVSF